ncbi:hypothetical protein GIB67_017814 [Kingdonia uniflora]|uniref:Uncharacterized protein n=1 Tax=Kingdonia uniflora TaxID=39325 RepID=A0A7J7MPN8_9MAGN|nr:hypothetical protein GIB67_017814 [Kingdonia uniflora]
MLTRSASTPILNSWIHHLKEPSTHESDLILPIPQTRSLNLTCCSSLLTFSASPSYDSLQNMTRELSETDLISNSFTKNLNGFVENIKEEEYEGEHDMGISMNSRTWSLNRLFSNSGLDEHVAYNGEKFEDLLVGGGGGGSDGNGGGVGSEGCNGFFESDNNGKDGTDSYYQKMIEADPGNALVLGNYARFLKEVKCDLDKAEEYCERALLVNPSDGSVASLYAEIIWESHKDASRADNYFNQAAQCEPEDCYVMASYARFLWEAEEEEEECVVNYKTTTTASFVQVVSFPVAAAS